ncbi:MAG: hypothetical protein QM811_14215 [Pirellulales bacterium]
MVLRQPQKIQRQRGRLPGRRPHAGRAGGPATGVRLQAQDDQWADPRGEYLAAYHAGEAYKLLGKPALTSDAMPEIEQPVMTTVGYHIRKGKHDVTDYDWEQWMNFADKQFGLVK